MALLLGGALAIGGTEEARAQDAVAPGVTTVEVPIVAGNAASARERALAEAFRQAVERSLAALLAEARVSEPLPPALADLRASLFSRAQRYVLQHRVLAEGPEAGRYRVQVDATIDESALRREIERARAGSGPPAVARSALVTGDSPEAIGAVAQALLASGFKAHTAAASSAGELEKEARAKEAARRAGMEAAIWVAAHVLAEGPVRGTGQVSVGCRLAARVMPLSGQPGNQSAESRAFALDEAAGRNECLSRAAAELASRIGQSMGGAGGQGDPAVTLDLEIIEPAALPLVLKALRRVAGASAAEVRRLTVGHVQVRVRTRLTPATLIAALVREAGPALHITPGTIGGDSASVQARLASQAPAPAL